MLTVQTFTFNPVSENTYVIYNEKGECCIIDPGCYFASEEMALKNFIESADLKPVLLLNTHCHLDHVFGNRFVQKTYGLPLHLHPLEKAIFDKAPEHGQLWGLPFDNFDGDFIYLEEGDTITLGKESLNVIFTPGHSPGSISFYEATSGFIISGDVLFKGSIGRIDLPMGDFATLKKSIKTKLYTLPEEVIVYPGHGDPTTIGHEKRSNPFVNMC